MKRTALITLLILQSLVSSSGAYSGGSGTPEDPYQIATVNDLLQLGRTPDDYVKSLVLSADIDLAGVAFNRAVIAPDLTEFPEIIDGKPFAIFMGTAFSGRLDGQGHVISNLRINNPGGNFIGLFGKIAGAEVFDLVLDNVDLFGHCDVGALAAHNKSGTISSCHITGRVRGVAHVGGLVKSFERKAA